MIAKSVDEGERKQPCTIEGYAIHPVARKVLCLIILACVGVLVHSLLIDMPPIYSRAASVTALIAWMPSFLLNTRIWMRDN